MDPIATIQSLIENKRAVYFSIGPSSTVGKRYFFTLWGTPSSARLVTGYGDTLNEAMLDGLRKLPASAPPRAMPGPQVMKMPG